MAQQSDMLTWALAAEGQTFASPLVIPCSVGHPFDDKFDLFAWKLVRLDVDPSLTPYFIVTNTRIIFHNEIAILTDGERYGDIRLDNNYNVNNKLHFRLIKYRKERPFSYCKRHINNIISEFISEEMQ